MPQTLQQPKESPTPGLMYRSFVAAISHRRISPTDYTLGYHNLQVCDPRQKVFESVNVTKYQNGGRDDCSAERDVLKSLIATALKLKSTKAIPRRFTFPSGDVLEYASFYTAGVRRAYGGKASPTEMKDALRLAYRFGRVTVHALARWSGSR